MHNVLLEAEIETKGYFLLIAEICIVDDHTGCSNMVPLISKARNLLVILGDLLEPTKSAKISKSVKMANIQRQT